MQGQDKGLLKINGKAMIGLILRQLEAQCEKILINANRNLVEYQQYGYIVVPDQHPDFQGPLAGMYSGLIHTRTDWMITVPCDGPILATDYCKRMMEAASESTPGKSQWLISRTESSQSMCCFTAHSLTVWLPACTQGKEKLTDGISSMIFAGSIIPTMQICSKTSTPRTNWPQSRLNCWLMPIKVR